MPLPQFLWTLVLVILAGGLTLWAATSAGLPMAMLGLTALLAAAVVGLAGPRH